LNAIYAFSATLLAWETRSSETRALATTYAGNAMRGLDEALVNYTDANSDALMAVCVILPWLQNDWFVNLRFCNTMANELRTRWSNLMNRIRQVCFCNKSAGKISDNIQITNTFQQYHKHSPFAEYLADQSATSNFVNETSYPLTADSREDRVKAVRTVLGELGNLQPHLSNVDPKWVDDLKAYITQLHTAPIAQKPKEQFDNLYHVRKMLLWAPVGIIRSRGVDTDTLVLLSYFYASALTLEPAFPDIGATFLSSLVASPLEKVMSFMQAYQSTQVFDPISQMLMGWPRKTLDNHTGSETRQGWSHRPSISVSSSSGAAPFELSALSIDLANQTLPDQYAYTPGLSPAFAPSTLSLIPPSLVTQPGGQRVVSSPFLEVPSSSVDSFYGSFSSSSPVSYHQTPTSTYVTSPLVSPAGIRSPNDGSEYQLAPYHHSRHGSIAEQGTFGSPFDSYSINTSQGGGYSTSNDTVAGGCVQPTAVWT
jgi:hypothetical protein